ncbi:MAG: hypothetical protein AABW54_03205 [Candidatus Micrarchaeota archaeon]
MDVQEKVCKELAVKYGYLPGRAKELVAFVKLVHKFTQYIGNNKYYSDTLNKRIALLGLDADILALKAESCRMVAEEFYSQAELQATCRKPVKLDAKQVETFKKTLEDLNTQALELHARALKLLEDIKKEYA